MPDSCFPDGSRTWAVHSPHSDVSVTYRVTIQVLSAGELRVAKEHANAARSNSMGTMGCCTCSPPKDIFSLESRVGVQALNANGILAKYCRENLPLSDAKGMRVVQVRGRRSIWLRMIRLEPPLTDAQATGAPTMRSAYMLSSLLLSPHFTVFVKTQWADSLLWLYHQSWRHYSQARTCKSSTCRATRSAMTVR